MTRKLSACLTETETIQLLELLRVAQSALVSWGKECRTSNRFALAETLEEYASQCANLIERIDR